MLLGFGVGESSGFLIPPMGRLAVASLCCPSWRCASAQRFSLRAMLGPCGKRRATFGTNRVPGAHVLPGGSSTLRLRSCCSACLAFESSKRRASRLRRRAGWLIGHGVCACYASWHCWALVVKRCPTGSARFACLDRTFFGTPGMRSSRLARGSGVGRAVRREAPARRRS